MSTFITPSPPSFLCINFRIIRGGSRRRPPSGPGHKYWKKLIQGRRLTCSAYQVRIF